MGLLDKIKSQKNEVKYSIVDKKIMIGGFNGSGKTSLLHEMSNIISEETGNNEVKYSIVDKKIMIAGIGE